PHTAVVPSPPTTRPRRRQPLPPPPRRIINVHPSLLPKFGGQGMYGERVHAAVLAAGEAATGGTIHLVTGEYDQGPVIAQTTVPVEPGDTVETLAARVLRREHEFY